MVARGAGAVGCAHCKTIGADQACQICTRLVCPTCAADWATCDEPSGRVVRLGLTARVRDVDPLGRIALVSHWRRPLRLFDLRRLRWIEDVTLPRGLYLWNRAHPPRLTSDQRLVFAEWNATSGYARDSNRLFGGIHTRDLHTGRVQLVADYPPFGNTGVSSTHDRYWYVTDTQQVAITVAPQAAETRSVALVEPIRREIIDVALVDPLPRKVIHSTHIDGERDVLAAGSWCEIALHKIFGDTLVRVGYTKTEGVGDVRWVAVAGPWLVAAITILGAASRVEVRRLGRDLSIGPVEHRHAGPLLAASLSRDGRYLALGFDHGLVVHELGTDNITTFEEHTDHINYVRFAADDHVLVSADTDNRIVMRPRTPSGYARPLVAIDISEDRVTLPARDEQRR